MGYVPRAAPQIASHCFTCDNRRTVECSACKSSLDFRNCARCRGKNVIDCPRCVELDFGEIVGGSPTLDRLEAWIKGFWRDMFPLGIRKRKPVAIPVHDYSNSPSLCGTWQED